MLFVPYSTDAPLYHLPFATVGIIVANVLIFIATTLQVMVGNMEFESIEWLILQFNQINPLQWFTNAFMHAGPMHLIGNMFFLWAFGIVVEGKIGSALFLAVYFIITAIDGVAVQLPMFLISGEGGALGASGVIFGLMMIAVIWAPENEMDCFFWFFVSFGTAEVRIIALGVTFIMMQIAFLFLGGFGMSSEMLHMIGAVIGTPIGFLMLRQGMVDCEGWDVVTRNSFLHNSNLFMTDEQRRKLYEKDEALEDPVGAALAITGGGAKAAGAIGNMISKGGVRRPNKGSSGSSRASQNTDSGKKLRPATPAGPRRVLPKREAPQAPPTAQAVANAATRHPEFNRLAFTFRQSVETENIPMAQQAFLRMDQMKIACGLTDKVLFRYVALLGGRQRYVDTLRPLNLIAMKEGVLADEAKIRIAQIHLSVTKKPQQAIVALQNLVVTEQTKPSIVQKRNQLLAKAKQG